MNVTADLANAALEPCASPAAGIRATQLASAWARWKSDLYAESPARIRVERSLAADWEHVMVELNG